MPVDRVALLRSWNEHPTATRRVGLFLCGDGADLAGVCWLVVHSVFVRAQDGGTMQVDLETIVSAVKWLIRSGWLKRAGSLLDLVSELKAGNLTGVVQDYQSHFGLPGDGMLNEATLQHLAMPRFCGRPDREAVSEALLKPMPEVRWFATNPQAMTGISARDFLEAINECWTYLPTVCGIAARNVASQAEANALVQCGPIDGAMGTLAWSELWNGSNRVYQQMYDTGEKWKRQSGVLQPSSTLDVLRVIIHESCHLLGLPHDSEDMNCLMAPTYSLSIDRCTPRDIQRLQRIYGPPKSVTKPTAGDTPANSPIPTKKFAVEAILEETSEGVVIRLPKVSMEWKN